MAEFDINHAVQLYTAGQGISNNLWTIYVVVVSAFLVFVFNEHEKKFTTNLVITAVFIAFVGLNLSPIYNIQNVLYETSIAISDQTNCKSPSKGFSRALCAMLAPSAQTVAIYHIFIDILVIFAIWFKTILSLFNKNKARQNK